MFLLVGSVLWSQDKAETPAQKPKEVMEKISPPSPPVEKNAPTGGETEDANSRGGSVGADKKREQPETPHVSAPGRRDPFRPFTTTRANTRRRDHLTPLERYELGQLKLVGVIWDVEEPNAMVEDSAGLGYIVKVGTPIGANDGKVKMIKPGEIIIEETHVDFYGAKKKRNVSMVLHVEKAQ